MESRWGNAATFIPSPPTILYQGGKTDATAGYTYTSAPNTDATILVPLQQPFDGASPPSHLAEASASGPPYAFHTISTLNGTGSTWDLLAFGGDAGRSEPTQTQADSVWRGRVDAEKGTVDWTHEATGWADQPSRRLYHSAAGPGEDGKVYITGGLKGDGSGAMFSDVYAYDTTTASFSTLPSLPEGTYGHNSVLLPNGTLVLVGGVAMSPVTGNAATTPMTRIYTLDTTADSPAWIEGTVSGGDPTGRRGSATALSGDGTKAFIFGGGDAGLSTALNDGWELDMSTSTWREVSTEGGPSGRFGHTALNVGGDQIAVFGGYGPSGAADSALNIWDAQTGQWVPTYNPPAPDAPPPPVQPPNASATNTPGPGESGKDAPHAPPDSQPDSGGSDGDIAPNETGTQSSGIDPTGSSSPSSSPDAASPPIGGLSTPAKVGLIVGLVALAGVVAAALLYRYRRKKRQAARMGVAAWNGRGPGGDRPYGSREKGGEGLLDEGSGRGEMGEKSPMVGLGMGAIGATLASISSKLGRGRQPEDPYAVLHDRGASYGGPVRRSTRRVGDGIRLLGPRPSPSDSHYAPVRLGPGANRARPPLDTLREDRIDMLHDEDSREFAKSDWAISERAEKGRWTSARSILGHEQEESDPFSDGDEDDDDSLRPPMRGGPVPTPHASRSDIDPFDDYHQRRSSTYLASFDDLLSPPVPSHSDGGSLPRSQRSGLSGSMSDAEEGVVHHAQFVSQTPASVLSPAESEYKPIKRTDSFFKRMTGGGFTALLSRQQSQRGTVRVMDIHDPTPAPALWPIDSRDDESSPNTPGPSYPPTAFKGALDAPKSGHAKGPSLSSLQSAKSMRDMVIVQREATASSEEEGVIEAGTPDIDMDDNEPTGSGNGRAERTEVTVTSESITTVYAHTRHGLTAVSEAVSYPATPLVGNETPGSIVFNGADFAATPVIAPIPATPPRAIPPNIATPPTARKVSTPPTLRPIPPRDSPRSISPMSFISGTPAGKISEPPSGSPVPSPLVSHRRAVKDVVNSINKRGGGVPLAFSSPASRYSPSSTVPGTPISTRSGSGSGGGPGVGGRQRPMTMYEAVKRERLLVANPDKRRDFNRTNSS